MDISAVFTGGIANKHFLPAYEGTQSLEGLARSITLISHYAITGEVRQRWPFHESASCLMRPAKEGSFETAFTLLTSENTPLVTTAVGSLAVNVAGGMITALIGYILARACGLKPDLSNKQASDLIENRSGDIDALVDAIEPAIRKAHTVINNGVVNINVVSGSRNIVMLTPRTKEYVSTNTHDKNRRELAVSVGMLNANTRNGRVYNDELKRTVGIEVSREAEPRTMSNLAQSLQRYTRKNRSIKSDVNIIFETIRAVDGTDKRYIVYDAFFTEA